MTGPGEGGFDDLFKDVTPAKNASKASSETATPKVDRESAHDVVKDDINALFRTLEEKMPKYPEGEADLRALYSLTKILLRTSTLPPDEQMNSFMLQSGTQNMKRDMSERVGRLLRILGPKN